MIGLPDDTAKPLRRAYSIASPSWDEELEFYSIKVQDGPLTSRLQQIKVGDRIVVQPKPVGTLVLDALLPGKRLYLFATGTGVAPFASLIRDPELYERFDEIILTHTCRQVEELGYSQGLIDSLPDDPLIGELAAPRVRFYPTITQEEFTPLEQRHEEHLPEIRPDRGLQQPSRHFCNGESIRWLARPIHNGFFKGTNEKSPCLLGS